MTDDAGIASGIEHLALQVLAQEVLGATTTQAKHLAPGRRLTHRVLKSVELRLHAGDSNPPYAQLA